MRSSLWSVSLSDLREFLGTETLSGGQANSHNRPFTGCVVGFGMGTTGYFSSASGTDAGYPLGIPLALDSFHDAHASCKRNFVFAGPWGSSYEGQERKLDRSLGSVGVGNHRRFRRCHCGQLGCHILDSPSSATSFADILCRNPVVAADWMGRDWSRGRDDAVARP